MSDINAQREWVLNGLGRLKQKGCQVEVLTTVDPNIAAEANVLSTLRNAGVRTDSIDPHRTANLMHSKYILVSGKIGSMIGKWTWTGSANLTFGALRSSDETMIQLKRVGAKTSGAIHDQYLCNFWRARAYLLGKPSPCH
jgi:phosphatidylserine/phosphatidylglycerophosphate/cardiolipin synthase-like enzyme